jgi:hypothetical protein
MQFLSVSDVLAFTVLGVNFGSSYYGLVYAMRQQNRCSPNKTRYALWYLLFSYMCRLLTLCIQWRNVILDSNAECVISITILPFQSIRLLRRQDK